MFPVSMSKDCLPQYRVQKKRFHELEKARKLDLLQKLKRDHEFSKEVVAVMHASAGRETAPRPAATVIND